MLNKVIFCAKKFTFLDRNSYLVFQFNFVGPITLEQAQMNEKKLNVIDFQEMNNDPTECDIIIKIIAEALTKCCQKGKMELFAKYDNMKR